MFLSRIFQRFVEQAPICVMARGAMEYALASEDLDALFEEHAQDQYTRDLLFSSVVDLMGIVVSKVQPSVNAAYQAVAATLPVSLTALYNKLNGMEPGITSALVSHTAGRLTPVIGAMQGALPALLPGYRVRILDGNHLAATQRRLEVLRGSIAGPLPGHALVVLDPQMMIATNMIPCEDGHAQERSLSEQILQCVTAGDLWIADRNFCTQTLLGGISRRGAFYVIRQHASLPIVSQGPLVRRGSTDSGQVWEQSVTLQNADGVPTTARRIVIRLYKPTRDGDMEMGILTNLPKAAAKAAMVAELYRTRWTLETMFQSLTQMLNAEIDTLAYPRAALLGFAVALATYNILSTVQAALRGSFGADKVQNDVSGFYIANEVRATAPGMDIAIEPSTWEPIRAMKPMEFATHMLRWTQDVHLPKYKRHPRGPKKPVPKRTRFAKKTHVSTARLLAEHRKK